MNELIYNQWHFPRIELAESYLNILMKGPGDPIHHLPTELPGSCGDDG